MKIGILGGTFDPIHLGHLAAARVAMECAGLDLVLFIPSAQPPHRGAAVASADDRLAMAHLAVDGHAGFQVSDVEIRRGGSSFTVDTLTELKKAHPHDELLLILGWDAARLFSTWHRPDGILELAKVVVVGRPGMPVPGREQLKAAGLDPSHVVLCTEPTPDISGSALRDSIAGDAAVSGRVSPAVAEYIASHRLYGDNRQVGG